MTRVVQKFGGSSVADAGSIKRVAKRIAATRQAGNEVVIVISAMGDSTDDLMDLALQVSPQPAPRELDMLLTTGERQSASLLAMALSDLGVPARSYTGSQAGVITTAAHGNARIIDITPGRVEKSLDAGNVVIVCGFQGVSQTTKDVTTLGRGASDTTAVALASALGAEYCEIYSDVDGVFTADPRIVPGARRIPEISYEEMLEMAACGAKILHLRCVEYARREDVPVHVRSSFSDKPGTWVRDLADITKGSAVEEAIISGVAHDRSEAKITIAGIPDAVGRAAQIFQIIADADINIDMIVQNASRVMNGRTDLSFTLPMSDGRTAVEALNNAQESIGFEQLLYDDQVGKVSVIGVGMRSHPGVTSTYFNALAGAGINLQMISTSEIRISVVVAADQVDQAVRVAHTAFGLDSEGEAVVYAGTGR
ncbi:MAG: aspartate kinase [Acidipropionibacterium acidipropionici]|jgi:aspartate kinase|uniref:Aspartokinase n=2 Tax=Acidipropionibacterium acidipropionici TaxID=1748 RepID=A0A142KJB8_9ACTN|nr:aspartate kinase [Acidipropionibacterium acidipropionici]AFV88460.1 aspartate kinase, monofunctional [Acidipropionibacterium acidipropionici ATCC 4875]ALN14177.1 aspartate kinase [Acidipropionibacterium acidipropionici]AMS06206.1 aspartate kinase [Acidipropionibacterium acidipropionici]AOZ47664.1 aspartate kinase [Acidipropionibacterium acidipropionici]APZ10059.1 aspartate kinase [Acidipropionibacterium acidipropionici]